MHTNVKLYSNIHFLHTILSISCYMGNRKYYFIIAYTVGVLIVPATKYSLNPHLNSIIIIIILNEKFYCEN